MAENNLKALSAIPVFGFEWSGCHSSDSSKNEKNYVARNVIKAAGCLPILNVAAGAFWIVIGVFANNSLSDAKRAALIARGVVTIFGGGIPLILVDLAVTVGRIAFREPRTA